MSYRVKLEVFEGPLDLLLALKEKNAVALADVVVGPQGVAHDLRCGAEARFRSRQCNRRVHDGVYLRDEHGDGDGYGNADWNGDPNATPPSSKP